MPVDLGADALQHGVGLRQVLVVGAVALDQIRDRVEAQPVDAHLEPELQDAQDLDHHPRVVEVEVRLVRVEAVPDSRPARPDPTDQFEVSVSMKMMRVSWYC